METLKKFAVFGGLLVIIVFLAFIDREAWRGYVQEKENEHFVRDGIPVKVEVGQILKDRRDWKDYLGFSKYISFHYQGKLYDLRYLPDSGWVGEGSMVRLLYSPSLDRFLQPDRLRHREPNVKLSKLIDWSVVGTFSYAHRWLLCFLALTTIVGAFSFGLLFYITGWSLFDFIARIFRVIGGLGLLIYFTWNGFSNYRYYKKVKTGAEQTIRITETEKQLEFNNTKSDGINFYFYSALVPDPKVTNSQRRIMISSRDYDRFHPGDSLPVYFQESMDEMMSVNYSYENFKWIFLGIIWLLAFYFLSSGFKSKKN